LLGIDAPEVRGLDSDKLEENKFLYVLDEKLLEYLNPKLTRKSLFACKLIIFFQCSLDTFIYGVYNIKVG